MKFLVIGTSRNVKSRSQRLAAIFSRMVEEAGHEGMYLDLRQSEFPWPGTEGSWEHEEVARLQAAIEKADRIVLALPVYCYDAGSITRAVLEFSGGRLENKVVGFIATAGGERSYMSVVPLMNSLMLDFRCWVVPRYVYATYSDWEDDSRPSESVKERLAGLIKACESIEIKAAES